MHRFAFICLVAGHDDRVRCGNGRIYLECVECGRQTRGWDVSHRAGNEPARLSPSHAFALRRWRPRAVPSADAARTKRAA